MTGSSYPTTPHTRIGLSAPPQLPPAGLPAYARRAESAGFDESRLAEDCFFAGRIAAVSAALSSTRRLTVGLGIMPAVARNAAFTAMEIAALAELYPARLISASATEWPGGCTRSARTRDRR